MKKFILAMGLVAFAFVGCDDSSSASAGPNDEPGVESSSSVERGESSSSVIPGSDPESSNSEKAKSSSSDTRSDAKQSSSSEKDKSSSSSAEMQSSSSETVVNSSSSVSKVSSSSLNFDWSLPKETYLNPEIEYDTIIDSRDGKVYKTVKIGDQIWMAENLNYYDSTDLSVKYKSWCYGKSDNKDSSTCDVTGRLYTWAAAMDSVSTGCGYCKTCDLASAGSATLVQGICPKEWHLPSQAEWNALFTAVGGQSTAGKVLKSQTGWYNNGNGTDAFGFSALPAGKRYNVNFSDDGFEANFWSATEGNSYSVYFMNLNFNVEKAYLDNSTKNLEFSVRCVKD